MAPVGDNEDDVERHNDCETDDNSVKELVKNVGDQMLHIIQNENDNHKNLLNKLRVVYS
ncbi:hypothetical protein DCAR_0311897 [Daucus carota subsp. sativus]|uniref:Uncharacterized protein n=1 Tax=Daucus carota subsp. sativus TaxID=79200 RepID=A0A161WSR8_DAUCS|nr:hypothetical protein DCAR_0311897 [Daucus carota subsp. sativus]